MSERIQRIPTALERWFLDMIAKAEEKCSREGNRIGMLFWHQIGELAREEFYYRRKGVE